MIFTDDTDRGDAQAVIEATAKLSEVEIITVDEPSDDGSVNVLAVPEGKKLVSAKPFLDEYLEAPERRKGTATLTALQSLVDHVNRFKDATSAIFADVANRSDPKLLAVLDYHANAPGWCQHRAVYRFPISDEWKAWTTLKGELTQQAFAEFLEERVVDVLDPTNAGDTVARFASDLGITMAGPQRLLELSRGLTVRVGQKVIQHVNLSSGEAQIGFEERHEDASGSGPLKVPGGFALAIPVFRNGAPYQVPVRLRYRVSQGSIVWWFALQRMDRIWDHAVEEACAAARAGTDLPLFFGTPEV